MPKDKGEKKKRKQESSDSDSGPDMENLPDEWLLDEVRDDPKSVHDISVLTDSDSEEEVKPIVECILPEEDELPISPKVNPPEDPTPKVPALLLQDYPSRSQHDETPPQNPRNSRQKSYEQSKALRQQVEYESDFSADEFDSFSSGSGDDFEPDIDDLETRDREVIPDGFLSMFKPLLSDDDSPPSRPNSPLTLEFPPPKRQKKKVTKKKINPSQEPTAPRPAAPQSVIPRPAAPLPCDADHDPLVERPIKQKFGLPTPRRPSPPPAEQPAEPPTWEGGPRCSEILQGLPWIRVFPPEPPMDVSSKFLVDNTGPTCRQSNNSLYYFFLFFTEAVWDLFVTETNNYARNKIAGMRRTGLISPHARLRKWVDVSVEEMKKYIGLLLSMGITHRKDVTQYWSKHPLLRIPVYSETMSINRFQAITAMLHLSSRVSPPRDQPGYDPWVKIREFLDMMNDSFKTHFIPKQQVCIDESMVRKKNHTTFIQYIPNKRHSHFGIKKFELCDSTTGYVLQSVLYCGKYFLTEGSDPFTQVVEFLCNKVGLLNKGYHIFTDNLYTKLTLSRFLLCHNTYLTGTINKKSKEISIDVPKARLAVGESIYYRRRIQPSGSVLLVKFKEPDTRKPVHFISSACHAEDKKDISKSGRVCVKPVVIQTYNKHMGRVNAKDRSVYHVTCTRTTTKYWRKIVFNFIDMSISNAYVLYKQQNPDGLTRFKFIVDITSKLLSINMPPPAPLMLLGGPAGDAPGPGHEVVAMPKRNMRICVVCKQKGQTVRTNFHCPGCNVGLHKICARDFIHTGPQRRV